MLGTVLSSTILSMLVIFSFHAYAYHDSSAAKQYSIKNSNVQPLSKHLISITGKMANLKGAESTSSAAIDMTIHKWNQYKPGATYSIDNGVIRSGDRKYKIGNGVMITHKSNEFLIIMNDQHGDLLGKLHGYMNGGYKDLQENKPVELLLDNLHSVRLSIDGKEIPKKRMFAAETGTVNPIK